MSRTVKHYGRFWLPLALAALLMSPLLADDDEDGDEGTEQTTTARMQTPSDSTLDSVYAVINDGFLKVKPIFQKSCFDCHSADTRYPWYHKLPLIKQLMDDHIEEGREHVDMTNGFPFKGEDSQREMLEHIHHEIKEGDMPIFSYRIMHWGALIEGPQQDSVFAWIDSSLALLPKK